MEQAKTLTDYPAALHSRFQLLLAPPFCGIGSVSYESLRSSEHDGGGVLEDVVELVES